MTTLHIALHDGFTGDAVSIRLDGQEVYSKPNVKTDLRISRADGLDVETPRPDATVEVQARGRTASAAVDPARTPYLAVDLGPDGQPAIRASAEPFAYL
jgi:hypothetical protein